jgi:stearoyl-CoA desaturase (Delta-9 desaturase)
MISDVMMDPDHPEHSRWVPAEDEKLDIAGSLPFISVHVGALLVFFVGFSWAALAMAIAMYVLRMFAITAGYHRYFSHLSFKTSRVFQFLLGWMATSSGQMGPLWWASHHRYHHMFSDTPQDVHSPILRTVYWSHVGWIMCKKYMATMTKLVRDFERYPELVWLNKWHVVPVFVLGFFVCGVGMAAHRWAPGLHTDGSQMLVWGFFVSTVFLYHGTFCINSFCHLMGSRRYATRDSSRNSWILAIITLGEGWHNNHHRYPASERQGFYWWEIDMTHYALVVLSWFGLVWSLRPPADEVYIDADLNAKMKSTLRPGELTAMGLPEL